MHELISDVNVYPIEIMSMYILYIQSLANTLSAVAREEDILHYSLDNKKASVC